MAALVVAGFKRLAHDSRAASVELIHEDALAATGAAYIAFAQGAPSLFRLMFTRELVDRSRFPDAESAGAEAYGVMASIVETMMMPASRVEEVSLAAWCIGASLAPAEF